MEKIYLCIDLKSFYASVECVARNLDPFKTNLVVADEKRGKGAICLAVTPKLKKLGVKNRCRLYEIDDCISYIIAKPRMRLYMQYSANVYEIYLKYIAKEDIHVYSIDEAFLDITNYLAFYQKNAIELAKMILDDIYKTLKITATAGIGTNLFLAKVALDICAKHARDNIGFLNEDLFKKKMWEHRPLTDFWQIGSGIAKRLAKYQIYTLKDICVCPEKLLYQEFGKNAQYLIDHAWGREPTTICEIKNYCPKANSISNSQILFEDYDYEDGLLILKEMVEINVLKLVDNHLVTNNISLMVRYSKDIIKPTKVSFKLNMYTNSYRELLFDYDYLYKKHVNKQYPIRQIALAFNNVIDEKYETFDLFSNFEEIAKEKKLAKTIIEIKDKYGKNSILKGINLLDKANTIKRNTLIGGHNEK